jgi:hypothetical protein
LQFLWGSAKDKVLFPAILALLGEYSEVWFDTVQEGDLDVDGESLASRTVPWISEEQMEHLIGLGKQVKRDKDTGLVTEWGSKISVAKALEGTKSFK